MPITMKDIVESIRIEKETEKIIEAIREIIDSHNIVFTNPEGDRFTIRKGTKITVLKKEIPSIQIIPVHSHFEVYIDGEFISSADTEREAIEDIENYTTNGIVFI